MPQVPDLPDDIAALKTLVVERSAVLAERSAKLEAAEALLLHQKLELEKLRFEIACLKRIKYGRSSEQLDHQLTQMQLSIEDLEASLAQKPLEVRPPVKEPADKAGAASPASASAARRGSTREPVRLPGLRW